MTLHEKIYELRKKNGLSQEELAAKINAGMQSTLGLSSKITFVEPGTIPRSEGKAKRITDKRKL